MRTKEARKSASLDPKPQPPKTPRLLAVLPTGSEALLSRAQVCAALGGISTRTLDRKISTGEFPDRDTDAIGPPRWRMETVNEWIRGKCGKGEG